MQRCLKQGRYGDAERLLTRVVAIYERALGFNHPTTAKCLGNLGVLAERLGKDAKAERFLRRCVAVTETALGRDHATNATALNNLGTEFGIPKKG